MNTRRHTFSLMFSTAIAGALALGGLAVAQVAIASGPSGVSLGTAASFAILAGTPAVTSTGATTIYGDLGIHPAAAVTGFPPGIVSGTIHAADAVALRAKSDLDAAYVDAAGRTPVAAVSGGALGGRTLVAGVYSSGGTTLGLTGTLVLDGQNDPASVWIFQASSDLITASSSSIRFINGGQPCNVFWQVTSSATLGSGSSFAGSILALTSITMGSGVSVGGRALARNGTVTMIDDSIAIAHCRSAAPTASPESTASPTPTPNATPTAVPAESAGPTPIPTASPTTSAVPTASPTTSAVPTASPTTSAVPTASPAATPAPTPTRATPPTTSTVPPTNASSGPIGLVVLILGSGLLLVVGTFMSRRPTRRRRAAIDKRR